MPQIHISDEVYAGLQRAAAQAGVSEEALAEESLAALIEESEPFRPLTELEIARLRESVAQLERGEGMTFEEVEAFFEAWRAEIASR